MHSKSESNARLACFSKIDHFDWIVFLPLADGFGAYNRYYGRQPDGSVKVRGIAARRHDTPEYIREMQEEMLTVMGGAATIGELRERECAVRDIYEKYCEGLPYANVRKFVVNRRIEPGDLCAPVSWSPQPFRLTKARAFLSHRG